MKSLRPLPLAVLGVTLSAFAAEPAPATPATPAAPAAPAGKTAPLYESGKTDGAKAPASYATYELRGFFGAGENLEVSLREKGSTESRWYKVGEKKDGILIEKADPQAGTVTLAVGRNRYKINLAGESAPAEAVKLSPEDQARQDRRARFRELMERTSPEQQQAFQKVMGEKVAAMRAAHPEWFNGQEQNEATRKAMRAGFLSATREAAEASAKLPDKFGVVNPVPADFDSLMSAAADDREGARLRARPAPAPTQDKAAPAPETKPAG